MVRSITTTRETLGFGDFAGNGQGEPSPRCEGIHVKGRKGVVRFERWVDGPEHSGAELIGRNPSSSRVCGLLMMKNCVAHLLAIFSTVRPALERQLWASARMLASELESS